MLTVEKLIQTDMVFLSSRDGLRTQARTTAAYWVSSFALFCNAADFFRKKN